MSSNPNFPSIGALAEQADALKETDDQEDPTQSDAEEDRPLQEIESLCMECGQQVCTLLVSDSLKWLIVKSLGYDQVDASLDSILQRGRSIFISLPALWKHEQRGTVCGYHPG